MRDKGEGGVKRMDDLLVEVEPALFEARQQRRVVDEREGHGVPSAEDDRIAALHHRPVDERDPLAVDSLYVGLYSYLALLQPRQVFVLLLNKAVVGVLRPPGRWRHSCRQGYKTRLGVKRGEPDGLGCLKQAVRCTMFDERWGELKGKEEFLAFLGRACAASHARGASDRWPAQLPHPRARWIPCTRSRWFYAHNFRRPGPRRGLGLYERAEMVTERATRARSSDISSALLPTRGGLVSPRPLATWNGPRPPGLRGCGGTNADQQHVLAGVGVWTRYT